MNLSEKIAIVLIAPKESLNIGSVARAMSNFGFIDLRIVTPKDYDIKRAAITACLGESILNTARVFCSFDEAIADRELLIAFSGKTGLPEKRSAVRLQDFSDSFLKEAAVPKTALLFGPEDTGLFNWHFSVCRDIVTIDTFGENSSLNLAQSVTVTLYELTRAFPPSRALKILEPELESSLPNASQYIHLDSLIAKILLLTGFYNGSSLNHTEERASEKEAFQTAERTATLHHLSGLIINLFRRISPTNRELSILHGIFHRIYLSIREKEKKEHNFKFND
jgi:tRNA/rRNA methyltransferase